MYSLPDILLIALGLAMDAFAVSVTSGFVIKNIRVRHAVRISTLFGLFQAVMPVIGWAAGLAFRQYLISWDHWIAFGLLFVIGAKMIIEALKMPNEQEGDLGEDACRTDYLNIYVLLMLSVATSIDALAVGLTLSVLSVPIVTPALIIGVVTFFMSYSGVCIGKRFGHFFERKIEVAGGLVLIGIGLKILLEHLLSGR